MPSDVTEHHVAVNRRDLAGLLGNQHSAGISRDPLLQTSGDQWRFRHQQRHGLALHVRPHQRAVGVVMFQERNQARGNRDQLLGRNIHVIHPRRFDVNEVAFAAAGNVVNQEIALVVNGRIGLGDDVGFLAVGGEVLNWLVTRPFSTLR